MTLMSKGQFRTQLDNDLRGIISLSSKIAITSYFSSNVVVNIILNNFGGYCFFKIYEIRYIARNPQIKCQIKINIPKIIFGHSTGKSTSVCVLVCISGTRCDLL
jgi:hypothetical protein